MFNDLSRLGKYLGQAARLMVGMPDYDNYVEHMQTKHPDKPVMTISLSRGRVRSMFFRLWVLAPRIRILSKMASHGGRK